MRSFNLTKNKDGIMKKKFLLGVSVGGLILLLLVLLFIGANYLFKDKVKESKLLNEFIYYDETVPGFKYEIFIYDDKIKYVETLLCSVDDCVEETRNAEENYSKDNIQSLESFIKENNLSKKEVYYSALSDYEKDVISAILMGQNYFELAYPKYDYKLIYSDNEENEYNFYVKDNDITVKKALLEGYDINKIETYNINFSKENMEFLVSYIKDLAQNKEDNTVYRSGSVYKNEEKIFNSLTFNDESYLQDKVSNVSLVYEITYDGMNCLTPILRLYSDNTYEYYDTFSLEDNLTFKTGTYDYDLDNLIKNIDNYEEDPLGPYYIKDKSGKTYVTYSTNTELNDLLSTLGLSLTKCLESA